MVLPTVWCRLKRLMFQLTLLNTFRMRKSWWPLAAISASSRRPLECSRIVSIVDSLAGSGGSSTTTT